MGDWVVGVIECVIGWWVGGWEWWVVVGWVIGCVGDWWVIGCVGDRWVIGWVGDWWVGGW